MTTDFANFSSIENLRDGSRLHLRAIRPGDRDRLREEFLKLSRETVRDRFFSVKFDLTPAELSYFTEVDFEQHVALVAELEISDQLQPVAVGRLVRDSELPNHSEIAITVTDNMQGKGIGSILLNHLTNCARDLGVRKMDASVLADNTRMMHMIRKAGLPYSSQLQDGVQRISVSL